MSEPQKGPVAWFLSAAWAVLFACVLLWIAVWLFQQIVWWLVGLAVIALTVWAVALIVRWRRDRWLR